MYIGDYYSCSSKLYKYISSLTNSIVISDPRRIGYSVIDANLWGLEEFKNQYAGYLEVYSGENGFIKFKSNLNLTSIPLRSWSVMAYTEIYYGLKPWTPEIKPHISLYLNLLAKIPDLPATYALVDYAIIESTTSYNLAFDIWLLKSQYVRTPGNGDVEVMIWLHRDGNGPPPSPAGRKLGV